MDGFALEEFADEDGAWGQEDGPSADDGAFAPEFMSDDYVRVTQLYCGAVGRQYKDYAKSERNLELDICNIWCSKPVPVLYDYCDTIKIHIFWPLLFQHQHSSVISRLYPCVDTGNFRASEISLKQLQRLELMEDIVDLAKKVVNDSFFIGGLLRIGYKIENKMLAMEEALNWVKYIGDVTILHKLGAVDNCWPMLSIFFTEYKYHITKVVTESCNILEEFKRQNCAECLEQGEVMKMKGNEEFSKERFDVAIVYYSRAIEYSPDNHLFYGNRALCFLRTRQFRNALGDGKRAIILKNNWTKGHYRYCAALSMLGEYDWALQANIKAQKLCRNDPEGIKDLIQQHIKLQKQIEDLQGGTSTRNPIKSCYESRACTPSSSAPAFSAALNFVETERDSRKTSHEMASGGYPHSRDVDEASNSDDCDCPEYVATSSQPPRHRGKQKSRNHDSEASSSSEGNLQADLKTFLERAFSKSSRAAHQDFANIMKMLRSLVQDGYTALLEQRCRSAAQAFSELLSNLDPQKIKQLNLAMINYVLVVYGFAISLLGIGQPQELSEAEGQFKRMIEFYPNEGLDCLAYCGIGKVYLKKNRFGEALNHFEQAKALIYRLPGVLTWPTSNVVIEETQPGKIKSLLEKFIEECRFPPVPDAVCSYQNCCGASKVQIYITDPDFKGFIRISCCQYCKIEFHINCWKKLKTTTYNDKIDKDFLQGICLTPDCKGIISKIIIYSSRGQVKCEFEHKVVKEKAPPRPILKQKCSSLEKQKLKEDKKVKRKIQKQEAKKLAQERMEEDLRESSAPKPEERKETAVRAQPYEPLDDRILQCIKLSTDKIQAGVRDASKLLKELLSWKVLSTEDYTTCFSSRNFLNEAVDYVICHLVQEKNRVKTRIFLHVLSKFDDMEPKLATWIQKLNSFGLDAAGSFFSRHGASVKELDFSILTFLWNEKYGHKLPSIEGKQLDYFCEPTASEDARFLVWLLEEHRDKFPALHAALDEFFDIMDSRCTVLRKQDSNDMPVHTTKTKNKGKKKKLKDSKPMLVGSGTSSVTSSNEAVASGGDLKSIVDPEAPFVVPEHLRQDVEEFEALLEQQNGEYVVRDKQLWPMNPKQKSSTLYDYFSQFLEEHGPLEMSNRMFCEKYEFFPEETRKIVANAGGLRTFLLQCPRFVVIDNCIALRKYASRLRKKRKKKNGKGKTEESSATGEFLRITLPLSSMFRDFKPDVTPEPAAGASAAPALEGAEPEPAPAGSPQPAGEAEEAAPAAASGGSHTSAPEEEGKPEEGKPQEVLPEAPEPVPEDAAAPQAPSPSPKPAPDAVKATYWAPAHLVTGYSSFLPFRGFDITQTPPAYINVLPTLPERASPYTPGATAASENPPQRSGPGVPTLVASDRPDDGATVYFEDPRLNAERAPGGQVAPAAQMQLHCLEVAGRSQCSAEGAGAAPGEPSGDVSHGGESAYGEAEPEGTEEATDGEATDGAHARAVAVQVSGNVAHQEVNTEPYKPFEEQQGDMSQMEREHRALQKQLQDACESYALRRLQGAEEIRDLEEQLRRSMEENEISQTELDWFLEDLEKEVKEWQKEKQEMQERVKMLKKKTKKISHAIEMYAQKKDGKDKELEFLLHQPCELSEEYMKEKMKLEENIRVGKKYYEKMLRRSVTAELSVLENSKETELHKLWILEYQADRYLNTLKNLDRKAAVYINLDPYMQTWETFISDVKREMESAASQFDDRIRAVREGYVLHELPQVQITVLSFPPYNPMELGSPPETPGGQDVSPSTSASPGAGNGAAVPKDASVASTGDPPAGAPSAPQPASPSGQPGAAQPPASAVQAAESKPGPEADPKLPAPAARAPRASHSPRKPFNTIIEHLSVAFPGYSSTELAGFVKKVRSKSKNSLAGLSVDDIVQRVTKHILDEARNRKPSPEQDRRLGDPRSADSVTGPPPGAQGQRTEGVPALGAHHCEVCHEAIKPKNVRVLTCGHKCHKGCLQKSARGQGTCPACLAAGEQPAPAAGDRLLS
ncbi:tetratricopeptide repeat domain 3 [Phyllostomus discolor]|uniref:RING-type E3 ubiquitin transferase n=1 Tax=Phyllostomus discolor TaxID=89673 RepID=A0A7E6D264_9CHIR|nr:E3 ubiquitin-protein ligase TTC3 [Phyllostomus discolor]KAF6122388.1 tetratricopeptide repeat domain 3 [Phyllostomus discolor]